MKKIILFVLFIIISSKSFAEISDKMNIENSNVTELLEVGFKIRSDYTGSSTSGKTEVIFILEKVSTNKKVMGKKINVLVICRVETEKTFCRKP